MTNAAKANYKRVSVQANLLEDTITWNDATAEFNLAGFDWFVVGWASVADLEDLVSYGMAADVESALAFYIAGNNVMSAGAIITGVNDTLKLSELAQHSMNEYAPAINADTEYLFYVYPFNAQTEMELYTHEFNAANLYNFGRFHTKALELGDFDAEAKFEIVTLDEKNVAIKATFGKGVKTVAYNWSESSYMDPEEGAAFILDDLYYTEYVTFDEYTTYLEASNYKYYGIPESYYLCVLAINEAGEYAYVEFDVHSEQGGGDEPVEPAMLTIDKVNWVSAKATVGDSYNPTYLEFVGEGGYAMTLAGYFEFDDPTQPYFNGAWYLNSSYSDSFNVWLSYVTYPDQTSAYFKDYGYVSIYEADGKYMVYFSGVKVGDAETVSFGISCDIEGLILPSEYKLPEGVFVPVRAEVEGLGDGDSNWKGWFYDEAGNCLEVEGYWDLDAAGYGARGQYVPVNGEPVVATFTKSQNPIANGSSHYWFNLEATWDGGSVKMEALSLPVVEKDKAQFELPNCENLALQLCTAEGYTSLGMGGYGDIRLVDANGKNYINIEINDQPVCTRLYTYDGTDSTDPGTLYSSCCYVNYNGAGGDDSTVYTPAFAAGTVDVVVDGNACTITVNLTLEDGNKYSGVYNGALPF